MSDFSFDSVALNQLIARRTFLRQSTTSFGAAVLASMLPSRLVSTAGATAPEKNHWSGVVNPLHYPQKIKRVIVLCMAGGPSHLETFDYKPKLAEMHGKPMPESFTKGKPIAQLQGSKLVCFGPQYKFKKWGKSGQEISEIFPHIGEHIADDICIVRSMVTEAINHDPAHTFMNTGSTIPGRPAMGAWINYGLGSESDNLPGFVVMTSTGKYGQSQPIAARQWHSGFLPSRFQGVEFRSKGDPVMFVTNPAGVSRGQQRDVVSAVQQLNQIQNTIVDDPEIATRIAAYETAFQMQTSVPELVDISGEPKHIQEMYGTSGPDGSFAFNCLLARRLAERGVRFIQLYHRDWDHHGGLKDQIKGVAGEVDRPISALIRDLKQRDMLKDTLVIWGGEFGRTPMAQGQGRDHHIQGFSMWFAGGGIKPGITYGATDELGYSSVQNIVTVNDLHATLLYLLGINHEKLTFRVQGRDFRLTDVHGHVVKSILA